MAHEIEQVQDMDPVLRTKLQQAGITMTDQLIAQAGTDVQREALAQQLDVNDDLLAEWVDRADLMRLTGVGSDMAELIRMAGIRSSRELARWDPQDLLSQLLLTNQEQHIVERGPSLAQVEQWTQEASMLSTPPQ